MKNSKNIVFFLIAAVGLLALPLLLQTQGNAWVRIVDIALLYVLLSLGLNIVVGYAGLLDLGFVAFFAIGAYMYGLMASPHLSDNFPAFARMFPHGLHTSIWLVIPLGAGIAGATTTNGLKQGLCVGIWASVLLIGNSLSVADLVNAQSGVWLGFIPRWFLFMQPLGFFVFMTAGIAETNRAPFDFPEAEQELVAGYHTEYSSMSFAMFFLAEYINMVTVSAVATDLFLGGWHGPFLPESLGWIWFLLKVSAILFFYVWMRWTLPRYRYDQLMAFGWKVLLPLAVVNLLVTAAGVLYFAA